MASRMLMPMSKLWKPAVLFVDVLSSSLIVRRAAGLML